MQKPFHGDRDILQTWRNHSQKLQIPVFRQKTSRDDGLILLVPFSLRQTIHPAAQILQGFIDAMVFQYFYAQAISAADY